MTALLLTRWAELASQLPVFHLHETLLGLLSLLAKSVGFLAFFYLLAYFGAKLLTPKP